MYLYLDIEDSIQIINTVLLVMFLSHSSQKELGFLDLCTLDNLIAARQGDLRYELR